MIEEYRSPSELTLIEAQHAYAEAMRALMLHDAQEQISLVAFIVKALEAVGVTLPGHAARSAERQALSDALVKAREATDLALSDRVTAIVTSKQVMLLDLEQRVKDLEKFVNRQRPLRESERGQ